MLVHSGRRWAPLERYLAQFGLSDRLISRLSEIGCSLASNIIDSDIADMERHTQFYAEQLHADRIEAARQQVARLRARKERWYRSRRRVLVDGIRHLDGTPAASDEEAVGLLRTHWSAVSDFHPSDESYYEFWKSYIQRVPSSDWLLSVDEFEELLSSRRPSAPGPDGILYFVYQIAGRPALLILYNLYKHCLLEGVCPADFPVFFLCSFQREVRCLHWLHHMSCARLLSATQTLS